MVTKGGTFELNSVATSQQKPMSRMQQIFLRVVGFAFLLDAVKIFYALSGPSNSIYPRIKTHIFIFLLREPASLWFEYASGVIFAVIAIQLFRLKQSGVWGAVGVYGYEIVTFILLILGPEQSNSAWSTISEVIEIPQSWALGAPEIILVILAALLLFAGPFFMILYLVSLTKKPS